MALLGPDPRRVRLFNLLREIKTLDPREYDKLMAEIRKAVQS